MPEFLCHKRLFVLPFIIFTAFLGCGKPAKEKPADMPELIPCEITVKLDGSPLSGATLRFLSTSSGSSKETWSVSGTTNASGVAKMQTYGEFIGVPEGEYIVLISKSQTDDIPRDAMSGGNRSQPQILVDPSFANPTKTNLRLVVSGKGPVKETFEVTGP